MKHLLEVLTEEAVHGLELVALLIILVGTVEALVAIPKQLKVMSTARDNRAVWLRYSRWLVAALTVQLAADIVESSISHGWEEIGHLGAVAVIRTFLNYFLDRDVETVIARHRGEHGAHAAHGEPVENEPTSRAVARA